MHCNHFNRKHSLSCCHAFKNPKECDLVLSNHLAFRLFRTSWGLNLKFPAWTQISWDFRLQNSFYLWKTKLDALTTSSYSLNGQRDCVQTWVVVCVYPAPISVILLYDGLQLVWVLHLLASLVTGNCKGKNTNMILLIGLFSLCIRGDVNIK